MFMYKYLLGDCIKEWMKGLIKEWMRKLDFIEVYVQVRILNYIVYVFNVSFFV